MVHISPDSTTFLDVSDRLNRNEIELWDLRTDELKAIFDNQSTRVNSVAYHPTEQYLMSGDSDGMIRVWNIDTKENSHFLTLDRAIDDIVFSTDGKQILIESEKKYSLCNFESAKIIAVLEDTEGIERIFCSPNGRYFIGYTTTEIRIWDVNTGVLRTRLGIPNRIEHLVVSPDDKKIATAGGNDYKVRLWNIQRGELSKSVTGDPKYIKMIHITEGIPELVDYATKRVDSIAFSPDGQTLAVSSRGEIVLWDVNTGETKTVLTGIGHIDSLLFSPDGQTLAAWNYVTRSDSGISLWNIDTTNLEESELRHFITGHNRRITSLAFSPDGQTLASGHSYLVRLWDISNGKLKATGNEHPFQVFVRSVDFTPDGKKLASLNLSIQSSDSKGEILLWDAATGEYQVTLKGHGKALGRTQHWHPNSIAFTPDGKLLVSGSLDGTVRYWNPRTKARDSFFHNLRRVLFGHEKATLKGHKEYVLSVALSPDGSMIASGSSDGTVRLWNVHKRKLLTILKANNNTSGSIHSLAFTPDSKTLIVGHKKQIVLWKTAPGDTFPTERSMSICMQRNNTATEYKTTVRNHQVEPTLQAPNNQPVSSQDTGFRHTSITTFALSPDGKTLAVGAPMGKIVLLEIPSFNVKNTSGFKALGWVMDLSFSPDGRTLASGSSDGTVLIWELDQ